MRSWWPRWRPAICRVRKPLPTKHGIRAGARHYEALIGDPDLDAVYIPLPTACMADGPGPRGAGKHVLCEKPFTANAAEAREIAELAAQSDRVVMEAFHYRYHPLTLRVEEIIASGSWASSSGWSPPCAFCCRSSPTSATTTRSPVARRWMPGAMRPHAPHFRRLDPGSRFGASETAWSPSRPGHDGRVAVRRGAHGPDPLRACGRRLLRTSAKVVGEQGELGGSTRRHRTFSIGSRSAQPTENGSSASRGAPLRVSA